MLLYRFIHRGSQLETDGRTVTTLEQSLQPSQIAAGATEQFQNPMAGPGCCTLHSSSTEMGGPTQQPEEPGFQGHIPTATLDT